MVGSAAAKHNILVTKLLAPQAPSMIVMRDRLHPRLAEGATKKITLIQAPAGFGKTTSAVIWRALIEEKGEKVAWLSLDRLDNNPVRLVQYILAAFRTVAPDLIEDANTLIEERTGDVSGHALNELLNALTTHGRNVYLVLDDVHLISESDAVAALSFLLEFSPPNVHFLIASRFRPKVQLSRLEVHGQVVTLKAQDLRFDERETGQFLGSVGNMELLGEQLRSLWQSTEGWVAALQLAMLSLRNSTEIDAQLSNLSKISGSVDEYLAETTLDALAPERREFLLKTSILDRLSHDLCNAVTGRTDSQAMLEELERDNLFIRPLDEGAHWFSYHHLFAAHLKRRLQRYHPEWLEGLHHKAADWFENAGDIESAVSHALACEDVGRAIAIIERNAMLLVERSWMGTLLRLVERVEPRDIAGRPHLQLALGWANCLTHRLEDAHIALNRFHASVASAATGDDVVRMRADAEVLRACIDIYSDRVDGIEPRLRPILDAPGPYTPWILAVAANVLTFAMIHTNRFSEAVALQAWAKPYHQQTVGVFSGVYGLCFTGLAERERGNIEAAAKNFEDAMALARDRIGSRSHAALLASALLGQIYFKRGEFERASPLIEESRKLGAEGGVIDFYIATYSCACRLAGMRGDYAEAFEIVREGEATAAKLASPRLSAVLAEETTRLSLAIGDTFGLSGATISMPAPAEVGSGMGAIIDDLADRAEARVAAGRGDAMHACEVLERLLERVRHSGRVHQEHLLLVQLSVAKFLAHDFDGAEGALLQGLDYAEKRHLVSMFFGEGLAMQSLLERISRQQRNLAQKDAVPRHIHQFVSLLLSRWPGKLRRSSVDASNAEPTPSLSISDFSDREVQILRLLCQGRSNKEIARVLNLEVNTIKWHLKNIFGSLGVNRRMNAAAVATKLGIVVAER